MGNERELSLYRDRILERNPLSTNKKCAGCGGSFSRVNGFAQNPHTVDLLNDHCINCTQSHGSGYVTDMSEWFNFDSESVIPNA